jgi:hypothetical protein
MILADNGSAWFISGVPDEQWNNGTLQQIRGIVGNQFEAVDESSLMVSPDSGQARAGRQQAPRRRQPRWRRRPADRARLARRRGLT